MNSFGLVRRSTQENAYAAIFATIIFARELEIKRQYRNRNHTCKWNIPNNLIFFNLFFWIKLFKMAANLQEEADPKREKAKITNAMMSGIKNSDSNNNHESR